MKSLLRLQLGYAWTRVAPSLVAALAMCAAGSCGDDQRNRDSRSAGNGASAGQRVTGTGSTHGGTSGSAGVDNGGHARGTEGGARQDGSAAAAGAGTAHAPAAGAGSGGVTGGSGGIGAESGVIGGGGGAAGNQAVQNPTIVTVTDTTATANIQHFGINLGDDNYWDAVLNRNRIKNGGFEGVMYRHIARGPGGDAGSFYDWKDYTYTAIDGDEELSSRSWLDVARGAKAWVLAGDRAWQTDTIDHVEHAVMTGREGEGARLRFVFADSGPTVGVTAGTAMDEVGMLLEKIERQGYVGQHGGPLWVFASDGARVGTRGNDLPLGSTGSSAAVLEAPGSATAKLMYPLVSTDIADANGTWRISFWAKGDGALTVGYGPWGTPRGPLAVDLTGDWQHFEGLAMVVDAYTDPTLNLHLSVTGGTVLLDDVAAYREGDKNPTSFSDDVVGVLQELRPGSLRYGHMGGSSLDNALGRDHERMAFDFRRNVPPDSSISSPAHPNTNGGAQMLSYGLHEFLELSAEVGTQPWYCMDGTSFPDEMANLMEYLAGPIDSPYGRLRAERGHPLPWTEVFDQIHIEMGNEAWNWASAYAYGGWNGPEYWRLLFERAKDKLREYTGASQRVKFHIGAQNYNTWLGQQLVALHGQAADAYAIAPYVIHEMDQTQGAFSDEQLFSWAYSWVWYLNTGGPMQSNWDMIQQSINPNLQISVYEVNHHITGGDAPNGPRNRIVTSIGGALNVIQHMLLMLERYQVRVQNFATLFQKEYNGVGLWGSVLSARAGQQRYRPTFQALLLANKVLDGDLVRISKSGANPSWHATVTYDENTTAVVDVPYIHGYATRDGSTRGLILLNLHRSNALPVRIKPSAPPKGTATCWLLTGPSISANNELDHEPEVTVVEEQLDDFADGYPAELPPHSMTVLRWEQ